MVVVVLLVLLQSTANMGVVIAAATFLMCYGAVMVNSQPHLNPLDHHGSPVIPTPTQWPVAAPRMDDVWPSPLASDKTTCTCGLTNPAARIVGGSEVIPPHKYPWMAGVVLSDDEDTTICGGSIINSQYILTAAHCFHNETGGEMSPEFFRITIGDHVMTFDIDDVPGETKVVPIQNIAIHPMFNWKIYDYDIALVKLVEPLSFENGDTIMPVCLPRDDMRTYSGMFGYIYGWGDVATGISSDPADILKEAKLTILDHQCMRRYNVTERLLCAVYRHGTRGPCQGDFGGSLTVKHVGRHIQVGIASWGVGCGSPYYPSVYSRVSKFLPWISENTGDAQACYK